MKITFLALLRIQKHGNKTRQIVSQEKRERLGELDKRPKYCQFTHKFHWSKNIDHGSEWVKHRTREIAEHVSKLFPDDTHETPNTRSDETTRDTGSDVVDRYHDRGIDETGDDQNDDVTYELASKFYDTLARDDRTKRDDGKTGNRKPESRCTSNEQGKWAELYKKFVDCKFFER